MESNLPKQNHFIWLRYAAAISIVFSHSRSMVENETYDSIVSVMTWLFPGVPILFFISGFFISLSYRGSEQWIDYIVKRVLRVFPPLWGCTLLTTLALLLSGYLIQQNVSIVELTAWFVGQLTVLQVWHPPFLDDFGVGVINGSLWVIPVIFQFYLLLPFVVKIDHSFSRKYGPAWIYGLLLVAAVANIVFNYFHNYHESLITKLLFLTLVPWAFMFLLGYFYQRNYSQLKANSNYSFLMWFAVHVACFVVLRWLGMRWGRNDVNPLLLWILAQAVTTLALLPPAKSIAFNTIERFLQKYDITFGIFVYHVVVINFFIEYGWLQSQPIAIQVLALFASVVAIASFSMMVIEKPIRDRRGEILSFVRKGCDKVLLPLGLPSRRAS